MPKSPLGALGIIVVLVQAVAAGALAAVQTRPNLQVILVGVISGATILSTALVIWLILHIVLVLRKPELLFNPGDFSPEVQKAIWCPNTPNKSVNMEKLNN